MKKTRFHFARITLGLLALSLILPAIPLKADEEPKNSVNPDILRGYRVSRMRVESGYHIVRFGFFGGEFSRLVREYESVPCCKLTHDKMSGCSAGITCS